MGEVGGRRKNMQRKFEKHGGTEEPREDNMAVVVITKPGEVSGVKLWGTTL